MPALDAASTAVWRARFTRIYRGNIAGLITLSDEVAAEAGDVVTIVASRLDASHEASGVVTGNKLEMLAAIEELLADITFNPDATGPTTVRSRVIIPDFRRCLG